MISYAPAIDIYIQKWTENKGFIEVSGIGICNNDLMQSMHRKSIGDRYVTASPLEGILLWNANQSTETNEWCISLNKLIGHSYHELSIDEPIPHCFELERIYEEIRLALNRHESTPQSQSRNQEKSSKGSLF